MAQNSQKIGSWTIILFKGILLDTNFMLLQLCGCVCVCVCLCEGRG